MSVLTIKNLEPSDIDIHYELYGIAHKATIGPFEVLKLNKDAEILEAQVCGHNVPAYISVAPIMLEEAI